MKLGITGTREGMTAAQAKAFRGIIECYHVDQFHHGSCRGVDVEVAKYVKLVYPDAYIVCHPGPENDPCRDSSWCDNITLPPKSHFARNRDIVNAVDLLIVVPKESDRQNRGGTWYSHDFAVKTGTPVVIIWPDGMIFDGAASGKAW